jgi:hypothetical protein
MRSWWQKRAARIPGSRSSVGRFFRGHDLTVKKSLYAAERQRADVARARRRWIREQGLLDPARLVFIAETATSTNMVREAAAHVACGWLVMRRMDIGRRSRSSPDCVMTAWWRLLGWKER